MRRCAMISPLYQGSLLPTLLMLVNGLVCAWLLWNPKQYLLDSIWLVWLLALVAMRVIQVAAFDSAMPSRQAQPVWRRMFINLRTRRLEQDAAGAVAIDRPVITPNVFRRPSGIGVCPTPPRAIECLGGARAGYPQTLRH